jgi:lipopolysaccharide heptosyltransferase II
LVMFKKLMYKLAGWAFKLFPRHQIVTANLHNILVIKLCCIGDILFTTPLLRALEKNFPRLHITYMVSGWCKELAAADPRVKATIEFNAYDKVGYLEKIRRALQAVSAIRRGKFDAAIVLHRSPLAGVLVALAGVPVRIGFNWQGEGFAHTHPVPFRADAHEIDRNLDCLRPLNAEPDGIATELLVPADFQATAELLLYHYGYTDPKQPLIAIFPAGGVNPGTTMITKRWPLESYRQLGQALIQDYQAKLLFVGNQADKTVIDRLLSEGYWGNSVIRTEGKTSLLLLAAILERCTLFIGGDSGPLHIAAAVKTPTLSLFGPTDPMLLAPRGKEHRVIRKALACMPCYNPISVRQGKVTECWKKNNLCMASIEPDEVIAAAGELLAWKGYALK